MSEFRILDYNYAFDSAVNFLPTSENPSFPASNLGHYFRSKVWRSGGNFVLSSSNNRLDFKDTSGGPELTLTLNQGSYPPSELATHIAGKMQQASPAFTYTVSYSETTGLWTISTSGTYLSLLWSSGTNNASSIASTIGFTGGDSTGSTSYTGPAAAIHTEEALVLDLGNPEEIDSFAILFDPRTGNKASSDAVWTLEACAADIWDSPALSVSLSMDSTYDVITHFFSSAQTYRYWRVKIVDTRNPYGYVEIPKIILSKATQLGQLPEIGFRAATNNLSRLVETPYGHVYADIYPTKRVLNFNFNAMTSDDVETLYSIYERVGNEVPIAVALDPRATLYDKDRFFLYGRLKKSFEVGHQFYTFFGSELSIEEAL